MIIHSLADHRCRWCFKLKNSKCSKLDFVSKVSASRAHRIKSLYNLVINRNLFSNMTEGTFEIQELAYKGGKLWNLDFKRFNLLFERLFSNPLLSRCNRVRRVYVSQKLPHKLLQRRRKLRHKIAGFTASEDLPGFIMFTTKGAIRLKAWI